MTHAVIWIDHKEARIFHVHPEAADEDHNPLTAASCSPPSKRAWGSERAPGRCGIGSSPISHVNSTALMPS